MNMLIRFFILMNLLKREQMTQKAATTTSTDSSENPLLFATFSRSYRVLPHDMGFRNHLPNYRYLSFIELNITGWLYQLKKQLNRSELKLNWIISMQEMVYLKEVRFLSKLTITSKLEGWDEKYLYFQHHFYVKNKLMAIGLTKVVLVDKTGKQSPQVLNMQDKHLTNVITTWNANQMAIKTQDFEK